MQHAHRAHRGPRSPRALAAPFARHRHAGRVHPRARAQQLHRQPRPVRVGGSVPPYPFMDRSRRCAHSRIGEHLPGRPVRHRRGRSAGRPGLKIRPRPSPARARNHRKRVRRRRENGRCGRPSQRTRLHHPHGRFRQRLFLAQHAEGHHGRHLENRHGLPRSTGSVSTQRKHP